MRRKLAVSLTAAVVLVNSASPAPGGGQQAVADVMLDGTWRLVGIHCWLGVEEEIPLGELRGRILTIRGGTVKGWADKEIRIRVDAARRPKKLDVVGAVEGKRGRQPLRCIYAMHGDTLRVAFHLAITRIPSVHLVPEAPRPTAFGYHEGWPTVVFSFKRAAK
jgi:uncharacterized protein (TIGR03067 family)